MVLLEREALFGTQSSGRNAAILRTFSADPVLSAIGRASAAFLREPPPGFSPVPLVDEVGLLLLASGREADRLRAAARETRDVNGAEELTTEAALELAPHLAPAVRASELCLWFEREGRLDVAAILDAFAAGARAAGAVLETGAEVEELLFRDRRVCGARLATGEERRADTTVLAAGAWAGELGRRAGSRVTLRPTRRHLLVTAPDAAVEPRWPVTWIEDVGFYCRPESGGLLLSGCDLTDVDPRAPETTRADPAVKALIAEKAQRALTAFEDASAAYFWHGLRTLTADGRFVLGPDSDVAGLAWAAGLGGHGMTAGAEVGRVLVEQLGTRFLARS